MAIISAEQAESRLNHQNNFCRNGRNLGSIAIPDKIRELAGFAAHFETAKSVGDAFGISPMSAHLAKQSENNLEVRDAIAERLGVVQDQALTKMLQAMNVISPDKIDKLNVKSARGLIKDMAVVIDRTTIKRDPTLVAGNIVIYAPALRAETNYEVIEVEKNVE